MIIEPLSPEVEYEKNSDIKQEDIAKLQEWMEKQPHLPKLSGNYFVSQYQFFSILSSIIYFSELELIVFYHSCESGMELTKQTIDLNFTMRTHWNDFFTDFDPKSKKNTHTLETL